MFKTFEPKEDKRKNDGGRERKNIKDSDNRKEVKAKEKDLNERIKLFKEKKDSNGPQRDAKKEQIERKERSENTADTINYMVKNNSDNKEKVDEQKKALDEQKQGLAELKQLLENVLKKDGHQNQA
jgi:hypothetical protein